MIDRNKSIDKLKEVFERGSNLHIDGGEEFNVCVEHIVALINGTVLLYESGFYAMAISLSITIIEEVAKTHTGMYMKTSGDEGVVRRDPLLDHKTKQILGANYTISMGQRLVDAIGQNRLEEIYALSYDGELKSMREEMFYWDRKDGRLSVPEKKADRIFSRDLLLFAIESFDDNLIGYTQYSMEVSKTTDKLFERLASEQTPS